MTRTWRDAHGMMRRRVRQHAGLARRCRSAPRHSSIQMAALPHSWKGVHDVFPKDKGSAQDCGSAAFCIPKHIGTDPTVSASHADHPLTRVFLCWGRRWPGLDAGAGRAVHRGHGRRGPRGPRKLPVCWMPTAHSTPAAPSSRARSSKPQSVARSKSAAHGKGPGGLRQTEVRDQMRQVFC